MKLLRVGEIGKEKPREDAAEENAKIIFIALNI